MMLKRSINTYRLTCVLACAALVASTATAGGSVYSRYGYGDFLFFGSTRSFAMGGAGIGLTSDGFINRFNPAGLSKISNVRFSGGFEFTNFSSQGEEGRSSYSTSGFQGFAVAIPISKQNGIVMSLESTPLSLVSYAVERPDSQQGISSTEKFYGTGGLSRLALGVSYSPASYIHTGLRLNYNYGRTRQYTYVSFTDQSLTSIQNDLSAYHSGYNLTLGTIVEDVGTHLGISFLNGVNAGAILTTPVRLDVERQNTYSLIDTTIVTNNTSDLPLSLGMGLSYLMDRRYQFVGDVHYQLWSGSSFEGAKQSRLRNAMRIALGFESLPQVNGDTYWKRVAYRAGAGLNSTYYTINGQSIDELFVTGGFGVPMSHEARLNLGVYVGFRGTTSNGLQKDTIVRLSVGISASELWFMKIEED